MEQRKFSPWAAVVMILGATRLLGWAAPAGAQEVAPDVRKIGNLSTTRITESSGLAVSRRFPGTIWTHNDGGGPKRQVLFATTREGRPLGEIRVVGALLQDWEDIAIDESGHLYVGDLGNNDGQRGQLAVYEIDEPDPKDLRGLVTVNRGWQLRFPKKPFDCESLFVWKGHGYVISKVFKDKNADIYRFPLVPTNGAVTLERIAKLPVESPVTGADISADGEQLGLVCKAGAYVFRIGGEVASAGDAPFHRTRFKHEHIEACGFLPDGLLATAESREVYLFTHEAFRPVAKPD